MGLTSAVIDALNVDVDNFKTSGKLSFTKPLQITGQYTVNGKVLVLPITGNGPCNIVLRTFLTITIIIFSTSTFICLNIRKYYVPLFFTISMFSVDEPVLELEEMSGTPFEKNGKTFVQIKKVNVKVANVKKLNVKLENLFNGNKQLGI